MLPTPFELNPTIGSFLSTPDSAGAVLPCPSYVMDIGARLEKIVRLHTTYRPTATAARSAGPRIVGRRRSVGRKNSGNNNFSWIMFTVFWQDKHISKASQLFKAVEFQKSASVIGPLHVRPAAQLKHPFFRPSDENVTMLFLRNKKTRKTNK
jgi:hypothetical protein